jgi:endonuclease YncB( thermonuclease family)
MAAVLTMAAALTGCTLPMSVTPPGLSDAVTDHGTTARVSLDDHAPVLMGPAIHIIDGDTIRVRLSSGPITVRLASIDAPEYDQTGGADARAALGRRLKGRQVELEVETQDQYQRVVAFVYMGGENINAWMVQQGYAWAYRQFMSDPRYCAWEAEARMSRRGLWSTPPGSQKAPWEWRWSQRERGAFEFTDYRRETAAACVKTMRKAMESRAAFESPQQPPVVAPATLPPPAAEACRIKGNISQSGRVYHVPGGEWYEQTQIDTARGERWFCTEAEAKAAGWRPAR